MTRPEQILQILKHRPMRVQTLARLLHVRDTANVYHDINVLMVSGDVMLVGQEASGPHGSGVMANVYGVPLVNLGKVLQELLSRPWGG